ncbi:glycosyltransferase family 1 protein [Aquimarina pacifica]|uniref:glycosyltransferase family 1 protein n=1 Tax=Aquimarina pacifica TaxID=1296415 RepID=UPI00046E5D60|nr:glycosyltransferase family 1 protein [Aquimarina pacifica]
MAVTRVLQVFAIMNRGGAESMIMNYYRNVDRTKIQFDFLVHRKEKAAFDDEIESMGGKIYKFDPINPIFPGAYYQKLRAFFEEHKEFSVVHSHTNTFSSFTLKIAKEFNIPCRIAHAHNALEKIKVKDLFDGKEAIKEVFKKIIKLRVKNNIHASTTHNFSCGDKAGKWLFGKNSTFRIMNNAVDAKAFAYDNEVRNKYKKEFDLENDFVLGHIGSFTVQKNHSYLLKVFASVVEQKPNCSLLIIGDGPLRKSLEKEAASLSIEDKVQFLGIRTDIAQLCQLLDVFVFPSLYEGLPVTLIEAQSAGIKIVASDRITEEVLLTNDIEFLPIEIEPKVWAEHILQKVAADRVNNYETIKEKGYDIKNNAEIIQNFYLEQSGTIE